MYIYLNFRSHTRIKFCAYTLLDGLKDIRRENKDTANHKTGLVHGRLLLQPEIQQSTTNCRQNQMKLYSKNWKLLQ